MNLLQLVAWAFLGTCTYGLVKGLLKNMYEEFSLTRHNWLTEVGCICLAISGPSGYLISFSATIAAWLSRDYELQLCFKMPNELWAKTNKKEKRT